MCSQRGPNGAAPEHTVCVLLLERAGVAVYVNIAWRYRASLLLVLLLLLLLKLLLKLLHLLKLLLLLLFVFLLQSMKHLSDM